MYRALYALLHGHIKKVQREVGRQYRLAQLLLFRTLLYLWAAALKREEFQHMIPSIVLFLLTRISLPSSQGGGTSDLLTNLLRVVRLGRVDNLILDSRRFKKRSQPDSPTTCRGPHCGSPCFQTAQQPLARNG